MSVRGTFGALRAQFRVALAEALVYRAEAVLWMLGSHVPFVMLIVWTAVTQGGAVTSASGKSWSTEEFEAYFLTSFAIRQVISCALAWPVTYEIRAGGLSMRLLRPIHPLTSYVITHLATVPSSILSVSPAMLVWAGLGLGGFRSDRWEILGAWLLAMLGAWIMALCVNLIVGALALFIESGFQVMDLWRAAFSVFSGYLLPLELFPEGLRQATAYMPFRYMVGLPVELALGRYDVGQAFTLLGQQWLWAVGFSMFTWWLWRVAIRRYGAFGG